MKLLNELNSIINENKAEVLDVNGFKIQLIEWDAVHRYYAYYDHGSMYSPPDTDTSTKDIIVDSLRFNIQSKDSVYKAYYDFSKYNYNDFDDESDLIEMLKSDMITIHDDNDDQVTDMKTVATIKNAIVEYSYNSNIFDFLRDNAKQEETEYDNGPD